MLGVLIMILNLMIIFQGLIYWIVDSTKKSPNDKHDKPSAYPHDYDNVLPFVPKIGYAFEY